MRGNLSGGTEKLPSPKNPETERDTAANQQKLPGWLRHRFGAGVKMTVEFIFDSTNGFAYLDTRERRAGRDTHEGGRIVGALKVNEPIPFAPLKSETVNVESMNAALTFGSNCGSTKSKPNEPIGLADETLMDLMPLKPSSLPGSRTLHSAKSKTCGLASAAKVTLPTM
jgi:hypothetical protein